MKKDILNQDELVQEIREQALYQCRKPSFKRYEDETLVCCWNEDNLNLEAYCDDPEGYKLSICA